MDMYLYLHYTTFLVNFTINVITLYIISAKTTKKLRYVRSILLNILAWNFLGNLAWGFFPFYPMFPLNCYLLLGYTGLYMTQLKLGNVVFNVITVLFLNACLGMLLSFKLRWIQIVYPQRYKNAKSHWTWIYGLATQIPISIIFYWLSNRMSVAPPDDPRPMFCFTTDKPTFLLTLTVIFAASGLGTILVLLLTFSSYRTLRKKRKFLSSRTSKFQSRFLRNLVILATISISLGTLPSLIAWVSFYLQDKHLETVAVASLLSIQNHGTILALAVLIIFRCYRQAVCGLLKRLVKQESAMKRRQTISAIKTK